MTLTSQNVFDRQQETLTKLLDEIGTNQSEIINAITTVGGADLDQPLLQGLISSDNPLYGPLESITVRKALLVIFGTSVGGVLSSSVQAVLSLLGLGGVTNQDIIDAIEDIDIDGQSKPIRGY